MNRLTRRRWLGSALAFGAAGLGGCITWRTPSTPMAVRREGAVCTPTALVVMLPGALSPPEEFVQEGFVAALHERAPACEVVLPDAHLGYLVHAQMLPRLHEDVVRPARARGFKPWLLGISLGGFAAMAYAMRHGEEIAGVLALAPYLGRRELLRDISAAGGPGRWRTAAPESGAAGDAAIELDDELWRWLADPARRSAGAQPPLYLGYGREDRFAEACRVLESLLPTGHASHVAGGHDWPTWRTLWQQWLAREVLVADCRKMRPQAPPRPV